MPEASLEQENCAGVPSSLRSYLQPRSSCPSTAVRLWAVSAMCPRWRVGGSRVLLENATSFLLYHVTPRTGSLSQDVEKTAWWTGATL